LKRGITVLVSGIKSPKTGVKIMIHQYRRYLGSSINFDFSGAEEIEHWKGMVVLAR